MLKNILIGLEIIVAVILIASVMVQSQGTGLDSSFGGSGGSYRSKRGVEKIVVYTTIICSAIFAAVSVALLILP